MSSLILKNQGLFDPTKRYAFTNIATEDFISHWNGVQVIIRAGQTIEISSSTPFPGTNGQAIANKLVDELVDKIMIGQFKIDEVAMLKENPQNPLPRSPKGMSLGVPAMRKIWEDQIIKEIPEDMESSEIQTIRKQMQEEIKSGIEGRTTVDPVHVPTSIQEFAELKRDEVQAPKVKKSARIKELK